ncbi:MAG: 4Fe-4S dicluster domain-containing protein [Ruminococcus sp.]|nr:4Fe-4S dicluster domain-containing protein [Ruminococcus sp.]
MDEIIIVKPEKCVGCNACVRNCPAPEANITKMLEEGRFVTTVNPERCITCGECVRTCNHGARDYVDDTEKCMSRLGKEEIILMVAPAIKSVLPDKWKGILDWFRRNGCKIYDVSLGADICTWAHVRAIENRTIGNVITQPCAAIVKYIEIYQPRLLRNLSPIHSPIACGATYIRKYLKLNSPIAVLSPCIAKKTEFMETGLVNYSITFRKLLEYFEKNNIKISADTRQDLSYPFDNQQGQVGGIYPRPGGLRDNLWLHNPDLNITTSEGVHKVYPELDMYANMPEYKHPEVFDVLSCEFGCNVGPASGTTQTFFDVMATMREVEKEAKKRRKTTGPFRFGEDKLFRYFDENLDISDYRRNYTPMNPSPLPTEKQLEAVYGMMGKHTEADRHYDCHACGYRSCREMAVAICRGLNTPENCIVHAKTVLIARHSELAEQHERLAEITAECLELSERLRADIDRITANVNNIGESTSKTSQKAGQVNSLLNNIVMFCNANESMDSEGVQQMASILQTTIRAFSVLDNNVNTTNESTEIINKSVAEISRLIDEINNTLKKSEKK